MEINNIEREYAMFSVVGDSMDNGNRESFEDGSILYAKPVEIEAIGQVIREDSESFWVVCTEIGMFLRKVVSCDGAVMHCMALNPKYGDSFVWLSEVKSMYRVMVLQPKIVHYHAIAI